MSQELQNWIEDLTCTVQSASDLYQPIVEKQQLVWDLIPQSRLVSPEFCTVARLRLSLFNWTHYPCTFKFEDAMMSYPLTDKPSFEYYEIRGGHVRIRGCITWPSYLARFDLPKIDKSIVEEFFRKCRITLVCDYTHQSKNCLTFDGQGFLYGNLWSGILTYEDQLLTWRILKD